MGDVWAVSASDPMADAGFSEDLIEWQKTHGRHTLPWQNTREPYCIWLSEIMLQQTQVAAVIPYYHRFMERFPTIGALAAARSDEVMAQWSGLGYYSRARNLHRCAQQVVALHGGVFPDDPALLAELPGIGRSTAGAIAAFSYGTRAAILDGNVKRVFARVFGIDTYPGEPKTEAQLWQQAHALLPHTGLQAYTQGLMDLGATVCTRNKPACERCPLATRCIAFATGRVAELPIRKAKKAKPDKYGVMLVVSDDGEVLLTQRPDLGIWGGLLSLPEIDGHSENVQSADESAAVRQQRESAVARVLAPVGEIASCERLQAFTHNFTHFRLHVVPYRVTLSRRLPLARHPHVWVNLKQVKNAPLPAPVKKLLLALFGANDLFVV
ncbi:MAG: A/G-specific adenine glycosylase [Burkholderiaceae bacterium]